MNVVLGVSGSVAAYRAADLARELMRHGCRVHVCLTDAAQQFVSPALFEALTGNPCLQSAFDEPERGRMAHIDLARSAKLVVIAPATASTLGKIAHGIADDMLSTLALATTAPILVAPAMNPAMYENVATQEALLTLVQRGVHVVEPASGDVACGENGQGKLASIASIVAEAVALLDESKLLAGKSVLITSGPTREPIDSVRYVSNRSSGKMGHALARVAMQMGAKVHLVSGPVAIPAPFGAEVTRVETAEQMLAASLDLAPLANIIIGVAAVADYRPASPASGKLRRSAEPMNLSLVPNPDIIAELALLNPDAVSLGFAAEPDLNLAMAKEKLTRKGLAGIVANDISNPEIGFDSDRNSLTLILSSGEVAESGLRSKTSCASWLFRALVDYKLL